MLTRNQIATIVSNISLVTGQTSLINSVIDIALKRVYEFHDWPYYMDYKNGVINTTATYSTGTVDTTLGSTSLDSSATTVFTSAMVGRKIRIGVTKPYYRITAVNAPSGVGALTIDQPYQGDTALAQTYTIFKDEYRLRGDVDKYKSFRQTQNGVLCIDMLPKNFDEVYTMPTAFSDPFMAMDVGNENTVYNTGTISASTNVITGVGTAWTSVEGLSRMSKIRIGSNWYTVKSIDSATQITTYEQIGTVAALSTYEILINNIVVQLYPMPSALRNLYYRYFRMPNQLANDYDLPDMPTDYHHLLIWGALSEILSQKGDINKAENVYESRFMNGLQQMKLKIGFFAADRLSQRKSADRLKRNITRGIEAGNFDRRYSW